MSAGQQNGMGAAFNSYTNDSTFMAAMQDAGAEAGHARKQPVGNCPHILMMGARSSGKTSIQRVVFNKTSPHETLFLDATQSLDRKHICNNDFINFEIWDFPGNYDVKEELVSGGTIYDEQMIFGNCGALLYVIDAQDEPYTEAVTNLLDTVAKAHTINPKIEVEVFIHKVDGDSFVSDVLKMDCNQKIQKAINEQLGDNELGLDLRFYLTSIYDHSIFEAFSKVVQRMIPCLPTLENLLNCLIGTCAMEKAFLFDVISKIYVATDSNPVDIPTYELCSDMIDVVIDISCIYGSNSDDGNDSFLSYNERSSSVIRLTGGMFTGQVLYLREVNSFLALVCLVREENFKKQGLIDYNIDSFKGALSEVIQISKLTALRKAGLASSLGNTRRTAGGSSGGGGARASEANGSNSRTRPEQ
mmetsp:Transcript_6159/g.8913  ORF Transcript_6159/g.8913 Transcript_6159/m.8913 type:complete len:416 (-) Transcript_6159:44-1291(-)|eukprot:CAMPEP_0195509642 /NCGR_PEP_ID=MMETSP0794_2-20130614/2518_1 /TAXON_ID=515487 /ORGANISM="Stephanopyxis turris, Strain CCMP 815" /LENGTH=415 /DNA_ID=CAMNT_0040636917 /DNA_START=63 /DNA_END=1310 /DNA_ORIENTATION=+